VCECVVYCRLEVLAEQRQMLILEEVRQRGAVRVSELTELFSVSDMTIRRDLDALSTAGLVDKVHGGATLPGRLSSEEPGFEAKSHRQLEEKEAIARAAVELVEPGQAIGLTAGTTTWRLAHHLLDTPIPDLTVVTNSMRAADVLRREKRPDLTVILTGGVGTPSDALVGPVAVATLRSLHIDLLFLGVHGISADAGYTTPNILEAETNSAFVEAASRVAVVADHTKWGVRGLSRFARLDEAHVLVTDWLLADDARTVLSEHIERLIVAGSPRGRRQRSRA
jgi:DeoR/GlpR family transcriptional regulator of sugar metabolism